MNIEDVIALSKAGFTSDQIMQMAQAPQQVTQPMQTMQQPTAPQQLIQPIQQPTVQPMVQQPMAQQPMVQQPMVQQPMVQQPMVQQPMVQQPTQEPPAKDPFQQLFEQMTGIKQAIQTNNIQNSQITGAAPQTTDDILASIIQPTKPKEE